MTVTCFRSRNIRSRTAVLALVLGVIAAFAGCSGSPSVGNATTDSGNAPTDPRIAKIAEIIPKLEPFFTPMGKPERYDWLGSNREPGQTFLEYTQQNPTLPTKDRNVIYLIEIGPLSGVQRNTIRRTGEYLTAFYGLKVVFLPPRSLDVNAKRLAEHTRKLDHVPQRQLRTGYVFDDILLPILPPDAAVLVGITAIDIFPDASMSFVFGQGRFHDRVAILSVHRLEKRADPTTFLKRSIKLATHEIGHTFTFLHCTKWQCVMAGTNHLAETDRRPIDACPECTAKVIYATAQSPRTRYKALAQTATKLNLPTESTQFTQKASAVDE